MSTVDCDHLDDEWVEEESLVLLELSGIIDLDYLSKCGNSCKIMGVETKEPVLQLGNLIFAGKYKDTLGTVVIFEEDEEQQCEETGNVKQWKYKCHTFKKLDMTRAFIRPKEQESGAEVHPHTDEESKGQSSETDEPS
ncbi:general transcription factor 3C polypeptide 6-like [Amphiura filiformis]|uniref:general transcription factor 3C polypeptide 6-like n=1 Tax=Amphiura filiformis TaxID=82378 RepID=UPI003B22762B